MTALNIGNPSPDQVLHTLFTAKGAPLNKWVFSAKVMNAPLQTALTTAHYLANVDDLLAALQTNATFQDLLAAAQPRGSASDSIFAATTSSPSASDSATIDPSAPANTQPCVRFITSRVAPVGSAASRTTMPTTRRR